MHEQLTEYQRVIDVGDDLDPEIPRHLLSVSTEGEAYHSEFFFMFSRQIGRKCAGKLAFRAYIRRLLNRGKIFKLNMG